jgi:hypothetical protein
MWSVRLNDAQRDAVAALIRAQGETGPSLEAALEALDYARWDDLPEAELPWDHVERLAGAQGISEADVIWDLACAGLPTPAPPDREQSQKKRAGEPA